MCKLTEKLGIVEINIYLLKRALRVCPTLWREKVLARLRELYEKTNNKDALRDMDNFMWDLGKLEALLSRSQMR